MVTANQEKAIQLNIARALVETKEALNLEIGDVTLTRLEGACGLDDSTISKVLDASRQIQFRYVEDLVHAFNTLAGADRFTPDEMVLRYNKPQDIDKLPPKLGFTRFLARQRQVPAAAPATETAGIKLLVGQPKPKINGRAIMGKTTEIAITTIYTIEPMPTRFKKGEQYAVKVGDDTRIVTFPFVFTDDEDEFEMLGRVIAVK